MLEIMPFPVATSPESSPVYKSVIYMLEGLGLSHSFTLVVVSDSVSSSELKLFISVWFLVMSLTHLSPTILSSFSIKVH